MLIEFNIAPAGKVQDIVEGGQVIEIEGPAGLVASAGFAAGVVKPGAKLPFFARLRAIWISLSPRVGPATVSCARWRRATPQVGHPLLKVA